MPHAVTAPVPPWTACGGRLVVHAVPAAADKEKVLLNVVEAAKAKATAKKAKAAARAAGAVIRTDAAVARVLVREGCAVGVALALNAIASGVPPLLPVRRVKMSSSSRILSVRETCRGPTKLRS